jgi:hypothetical protein
MNRPASERRRAPRAIADFPIVLAPQEGAAPAQLKDLSTIGLCCTTAARLKEMALVGVDLQLPGHKEAHRVHGAVVRCAPVAGQQGRYEVAIWFTEVGERAKQALGAWVARAVPAR